MEALAFATAGAPAEPAGALGAPQGADKTATPPDLLPSQNGAFMTADGGATMRAGSAILPDSLLLPNPGAAGAGRVLQP
jgi:hypothetical protein